MRIEDSIIADDFINAKVRGMRSKLFEDERLTALADSRSLPELFRRITPKEGFEGLQPFQRNLLSEHVGTLLRVRKYISGPILRLFQRLLERFAVDNLKVVLRAYQTGLGMAETERLLVPLPPDLAIPAELLLETPDPRRFVDRMPLTDLRETLSRHLRPGERMDLFAVEMALDSAYWRNAIEAASAAGAKSCALVAHDCAIHNLLLLLRARFEFDLEFDRVSPYLVNDGLFLGARAVAQVYEAPDLAQALGRVSPRLAPPALLRNRRGLPDVEDALLLHQYRLAMRCFAESVLDVAVVIAFYYIKRAELMNLMRLSEGVRHSLPREAIQSSFLMRSHQ